MKNNYCNWEKRAFLFTSNPQFEIDIDILIKERVIKQTTGNKLIWTKSKTSLAEYFKWINLYNTYTPGGFWAPIEYVFLIKGKQIKRGTLSKLASGNGNPLKPHESTDFKMIKKIVNEYRKKIEQQEKEQQILNNNIQAIQDIINNINDDDIKTLQTAKIKLKKIITVM